MELLAREGGLAGGRVLDVGCGTGALAAALAERGAKVWGIDPSAEMLAVARARVPRGVGLKLARAEALPFTDGWFDAVVFSLVVHLVERLRALAEARRVLAPGGRAVVLTFDPVHFGRSYLGRYFPSIEGIDRARFPGEEELRVELQAAGFRDLRFARLHEEGVLSREEALERIRGRAISTFQLLDEEEYRAGLERAERELPARVAVTRDFLIAVGRR